MFSAPEIDRLDRPEVSIGIAAEGPCRVVCIHEFNGTAVRCLWALFNSNHTGLGFGRLSSCQQSSGRCSCKNVLAAAVGTCGWRKAQAQGL